MAKRIPVTIGGRKYTLVSDENPECLQRLAEMVNNKFLEQRRRNLSEVESAIMAALIIADESLKTEEASENIRAQILGCLEDLARIRAENSELKRELSKYR